MRKIASAASAALGVILASPVMALAVATGGSDINIEKPKQVQYTNLGGLISNLVGFILIIASLVFFFMLVVGGVQWMLSGGDKQGTEAARGRITAALIGLLIVFSAWAITKLVEAFLGITILGGINVPIPGELKQ